MAVALRYRIEEESVEEEIARIILNGEKIEKTFNIKSGQTSLEGISATYRFNGNIKTVTGTSFTYTGFGIIIYGLPNKHSNEGFYLPLYEMRNFRKLNN